MTNYMGKRRLLKIFYHYISDRKDIQKKFKEEKKNDLKNVFYKKYRGTERLTCYCEGYKFEIHVFGNNYKIVQLKEFIYNENDSAENEYASVCKLTSCYNKNFYPNPSNKSKLLDCHDFEKSNYEINRTAVVHQTEDNDLKI